MLNVPMSGPLGDDAEAAPLSVFHGGGRRRPLVFVRSWFGELEAYRRLAWALGPERPIVTIAPPRGEHIGDFPDSVASWAALCRERARDVLREGAILGGVSFGGVIALDLARALQRESHGVAHLLMIDSWLPRKAPRKPRSLPHRVLYQLSRTLDEPRGRRLAYLRARAEAAGELAREHLPRWWRPQRAAGASPGGEDVITSTGRKMPLLKRAIWVSYLKYSPEPCELPVSLFRSDESLHRVGDAALGWGPWLRGPLEIAPVEGGHLELLSEVHAPGLARRVERSVADLH